MYLLFVEGNDGSPGNEERCNLLESPIQDLHFEGLSDEVCICTQTMMFIFSESLVSIDMQRS